MLLFRACVNGMYRKRGAQECPPGAMAYAGAESGIFASCVIVCGWREALVKYSLERLSEYRHVVNE